MSLYAPFLICWSLIWLTNISEEGSDQESSHGYGKTYSTVPYKNEGEPKHRGNGQDKPWNVSNFFGMK